MDGKYLLKRGRTWYVRFAIPYSVQDIFGKQEFVQSLKTKDFQEAKLLKHKYLDRYAQMIFAAKRQIRSNRSKEDQLIDLGLMLRQFNTHPSCCIRSVTDRTSSGRVEQCTTCVNPVIESRMMRISMPIGW